MDISAEAADSRAALEELAETADAASANWTTPRAPGKWSPSQVTEHVARVFDDAAKMIEGKPNGFPTMPFFVRPIFRTVFFNRTVKSGTFPTARTFKPFDPIEGPDTPVAARQRLAAAHDRYLNACSACAGKDGKVASSVFGAVSVTDYMRFTTMHTRHHRTQIPTA
jgi:DinB superfamily